MYYETQWWHVISFYSFQKLIPTKINSCKLVYHIYSYLISSENLILENGEKRLNHRWGYFYMGTGKGRRRVCFVQTNETDLTDLNNWGLWNKMHLHIGLWFGPGSVTTADFFIFYQ